MSVVLINNLAAATTSLRQAMQQADLSNIEMALARFRTSMEAVQAVGTWRDNPELKGLIADLLGELESSRALACLLGDMAGQRHAAMAARNLDHPQPLYSPANMAPPVERVRA